MTNVINQESITKKRVAAIGRWMPIQYGLPKMSK